MSTVLHPTAEELYAQRRELLRQAGYGLSELQQRAEEGLLTGREYWLWREIKSIEFLLGEDD